MVTGASTADLALLLVDARKGVLEQTRRHAFLASLLRVPHVVLCVNKMDLVGFDRGVYEEIKEDFRAFAAKLAIGDLAVIPVSALGGDNIVSRSPNTPWYEGSSLLYHLEELHIASDRNLIDVRFPVQWAVRPRSEELHDYRGYAGTVAGGVLKPGDDVILLPSGLTSVISGIDTFDGPVAEAFPPMSVTVLLADDLDVSRGDMLARPQNQPTVGQDLELMVSWMVDAPLRKRARIAVKHTTRVARAMVADIRYRVDTDTLHRDESAAELRLNDIGRVRLHTTTPLCHDPYRRNRATGGLILVDESTGATLGAGMII
jgi:bifunctional enzyme CysN/CysC/sulfate adenylyltransferase subunit 1